MTASSGAALLVASPVRTTGLRLFAWLGLLLAALLVLDFAGWYGYMTDLPIRIAMQVAAYLVLGGWLLVAIARPAWLPRSPLAVPVVGVTAVFLLTCVLSQVPRLSLDSALIATTFAGLFLLLGRLVMDTWFRARVRVVLIAIPVVVSLAYLVQVALSWLNWWSLVGAVTLPPLRPDWAGLTFGSPNLVATVLLLSAPLAVSMVGSAHRWFAIAIGGLAATAIVLSGSRGALVGVGVAAITALLLSLWLPDLRSRLSSRRARASLGVIVGAAVLATPLLLARFAQGGDALRIDLWRSALALFADHPLTGSGPGTWVQLKLAANPAGAANLVLPHVHDLYLQILSEEGIAGFAALLVLGVLLGRRLLQGVRSRDPALRAESLAVTLGLVAVGGQCLTDNVTNLPAVCLLLVAVVAWIDGRLTALENDALPAPNPVAAKASARPVARGFAAVALLGLVITIPMTVILDRAALAARAGNAAAATGDWREAAARYRDAADTDSGMSLYRLELAVALARVGDAVGARALYADLVNSDALPLNLASLAFLDEAAGDCPAAMAHANDAMAGTSGDAGIALNAGAVAERCGERARAVGWYAEALAAAPQLAADPYWDEPGRTSERTAIIAAADVQLAASGDASGRVLLQAASGNADAARTELASLPAPCPVCAASVSWAAGDRQGAIDALEAQMAAHPLDYVSAAALARDLWLVGRDDDAARYAHWAEIVETDAAPTLESAPNAIAVDAPGAILQPPAYPLAVYGRDGAPSMWPPGMLTPVLAR